MKINKQLFMFLILMSLGNVTFSAEVGWDARSLFSSDPKERGNAWSSLRTSKEDIVRQAVTILNSSTQEAQLNDVRFTAIAVLGFLREVDGSQALVKNIDLGSPIGVVPVGTGDREITPATVFPAVKALLAIGEPAMPACLTGLEEGDVARREILCWLVVRLMGRTQAQTLLRSHIASCQNVAARTNLEAAMELIRKDQPWKHQNHHRLNTPQQKGP